VLRNVERGEGRAKLNFARLSKVHLRASRRGD
jgi:hypothetical protein